MMAKVRILLADDHKIVVEGLRSLLQPEFDLVGTAENGLELIDAAERLRPDVIVTDISMPLLNGIDAVSKLRQAGVDAKVVFLTMHPDLVFATRALEAGASGYVLKHSAPDELITAIHEAVSGGLFISQALRSPALEELLDPSKRHLKTNLELTGRQREVLQLLAEGKSAKEIATILNISPRTVETHKYKIMDELGAKTSAELVQHAIKHGLIAG
ncbi:MAG TPA: response regulator transcription factor [Bryobacteraceae bacterium]|nr:response regulator transcription factor [Bryobacteraceae bacterium]